MLKAGNVPAEQMKWLQGLAKRLGEGAPLSGDANEAARSAAVGKLDPMEASQRLDEIYANKNHPFHKSSHPDYKAAVDRVMSLMRMVNP
jgi:hypothetical protein